MKNLQFSKNDILSALLDITKDSMVRGELTRSLIDAKIKRLVSKKKFETRSMMKKNERGLLYKRITFHSIVCQFAILF